MIVNGVTHQSDQATTVARLLDDLAIEPRGVAVAINGEIVRRSQWDVVIVTSSDRVEVVTAVAGG